MAGNYPIKDSEEKTFRIALVMAGAISAGAYTAGVIDHLIETLEKWEKAKKQGVANVPPHKVVIEVMSGTSGGGMNAALALADWTSNQTPGTKSILYKTWVEDIDIKYLLNTDKETPYGPDNVLSVLNSSRIEEIATSNFKYELENINEHAIAKRRYISDNVELFLTVSNLTGIPYCIKLNSFTGAKGHEMKLYRDYIHFEFAKEQKNFLPNNAGAIRLDNRREPWELLRQTAMATGAFPVFLRPRELTRNKLYIEQRKFDFPPQVLSANPGQSNQVCVQVIKDTIQPDWQEGDINEDGVYESVNVDGGLFHNEAFEFADQRLIERKGGFFKSYTAEDMSHASIMIDPFPNTYTKDDKGINKDAKTVSSIFDLINKVFSAIIDQLLFKLEYSHLAARKEVFDHFVIAPSRPKKQGEIDPYGQVPMAGASLEGFGAFLSQEFREYDYQLGRRNCQDFLRYSFVIPEEVPDEANPGKNKAINNPLFADWTDEMKKRFRIYHRQKNNVPSLPIIPDMDFNAQSEVSFVPPPAFPKFSQKQLNALKWPIHKRLLTVLFSYAKGPVNISEVFVFILGFPAFALLYLKLHRKIIKWMKKSLQDHLLLNKEE